MSTFNVAHNSDMNVTPFVDVMLVLLIIMMVSIPVATVSLNMDIPPPVASPVPVAPPIVVTLQEDGAVFVGQRPTSLAGLPDVVAAALGVPNPSSQRVYLRAQRGVRYGALMTVMNRLQASGYHQVALVSEEI